MFDQSEKTLETSGNMVSSSYDVALNGKAFKVLMSAIYSDKIKSVVREIWSNALDSHVMAGKEHVPFEVNWPSMSDPNFHVRDFGIGLSPEDIERVYKTLFKSTKEQQKFQVGRYGLGSKTPFGYTDSFSVTSIHNGVKTFYSSVIKADGIPDMYIMHSEETDEMNGVTVSFPIEISDIKSFHIAMKDVALGFNVKPVCKNGEEIDWPTLGDEIIEGIYEAPQLTQMWLRQGPVLYPFDLDAFKKISVNDQVIKFLSGMYRTGVVIDFDMDALEMSASREALQYGREDPTVYSIERRIIKIREGFEEKAREAAAIEDFVEAGNAFARIFDMTIAPLFIPTVMTHEATGISLTHDRYYHSTVFGNNFVGVSFIHRAVHHYLKGIQRGSKLDTTSMRITDDMTPANTEIVFITHDYKDKTRASQGVGTLADRIAKKFEPAEGEEYKKLLVVRVWDNIEAMTKMHFFMEIFKDYNMSWAGEFEREPRANKGPAKTLLEKFGCVYTRTVNKPYNLEEILAIADDCIFISANANTHNNITHTNSQLFDLLASDKLHKPQQVVLVTKWQANILMQKCGVKGVMDIGEFMSEHGGDFDFKTKFPQEVVDRYLSFRTQEIIRTRYSGYYSWQSWLMAPGRGRKNVLTTDERKFFADLAQVKNDSEYSADEKMLFTRLMNYDSNNYSEQYVDEFETFFERSDTLKIIKLAMKRLGYYEFDDFFSNDAVVDEVRKEIELVKKEKQNV